MSVAVCLAEKQLYEVHRQERQLELCERRQHYQWSNTPTHHTRNDDSMALPRRIQVTLIVVVVVVVVVVVIVVLRVIVVVVEVAAAVAIAIKMFKLVYLAEISTVTSTLWL